MLHVSLIFVALKSFPIACLNKESYLIHCWMKGNELISPWQSDAA